MSSEKIEQARAILSQLDLPRSQQNERSAIVLLALVNLTPEKSWQQVEAPLIGITPMMSFANLRYKTDKPWAPNTRETIRKLSVQPFVEAGLVIANPGQARSTNSPQTVYQIESHFLTLLTRFGTEAWQTELENYFKLKPSLAERYKRERNMNRTPVIVAQGKEITLSIGEHSSLLKAIIEEFAPRFLPGSRLIYVGDTGEKWNYFDNELLLHLGVTVDNHGKMPDVVLYYPEKQWLVLAEAVTSSGPVDNKRRIELEDLFSTAKAPLLFVTAFPNGRLFRKFASEISWETEVWIADNPTHVIHYDGIRFLGPY